MLIPNNLLYWHVHGTWGHAIVDEQSQPVAMAASHAIAADIVQHHNIAVAPLREAFEKVNT